MTLSRFTKVFSSLPPAERNLVCCIIDEDGISWRLAYDQIKEDTELGRRVQAELEKLELI